LSHFANQTYFLIDVKTKRDKGDFNINPFVSDQEDLLGLDQNFKNSFFFNRGLQRFSFVYSFLNLRKKSIFSFGDQDVNLKTHQFQFIHKLGKFWLMDLGAAINYNSSSSDSFLNRNYDLNNLDLNPKISYLYNQNTRLELFYNFKDKANQILDMETLQMHIVGSNFQYASKQSFSVNANASFYFNEFEGNSNWGYSPTFYFAPDKYYGPLNTLKQFIDACHQRGIAVILDIVLNHSWGPSPFVRLYNEGDYSKPTAENPWYNIDSPNPVYSWGYDFDHESPETKKLVDRINKFWLTEYNVDGFRFDFTKGFTNTPGDGGGYDNSRIAILKRMADKIWDVKEFVARHYHVIIQLKHD